jgi:hypothetical protein
MKNPLSYLKFLMLPILFSVSFICSFYLTIIFFLILMINEAINGKSNPTLKEDFSSFIQKVSDFPQEMLFPSEKKEFEWSE